MRKKFVCDGMLGKLCKLLRTCGIDASYSNEGMAILLQARKEGRIVLTRNTHLSGKQNVFSVELSAPKEQLMEIIARFGLHEEIHPFSRCIECNAELDPVEKKSVEGRVPYFTYKNFNRFAQCRGCGKIYWEGSHYKHMLRDIEDVMKAKQDSST
jgi:uncharacterized protein with PIN domain